MAEKKNSGKTFSFRIDDDTVQLFRAIASDNFPDQSTALSAMIDLYRLNQLRENYPQFQADIATLEEHFARFRNYAFHLLETAAYAYENACEGLHSEIQHLRKTNDDLRCKVQQLEQERDSATNTLKDTEDRLKTAERNIQLAIAAKDLASRNMEAMKASEEERQSYLTSLLKQLDSMQQEAERCSDAEKAAGELRMQLSESVAERKIAIAETEARNAAEAKELLRQITSLQGQLHDAERRALSAEASLKALQDAQADPGST